MTTSTPFLPGLSPLAGKSLTVTRDAGKLTSNGGLIVLREVARRLDIAARIAKHIPDARNPALITHTHADMTLARMMMIAAGHEDCGPGRRSGTSIRSSLIRRSRSPVIARPRPASI